jgi:hypothetical protein
LTIAVEVGTWRIMNFLPAYLSVRKRKPDLDSPAETEDRTDSRPVFELVPPSAEPANDDDAATEALLFDEPAPKQALEPALPAGRNVHPINAEDLRRLSIDNDGRLYWDGKPVEVRRSIQMSRTQVIGASVVAAFVIMGALGAIIQGSLAARDWACRLGWTSSYCGVPNARPQPRADIPA